MEELNNEYIPEAQDDLLDDLMNIVQNDSSRGLKKLQPNFEEVTSSIYIV